VLYGFRKNRTGTSISYALSSVVDFKLLKAFIAILLNLMQFSNTFTTAKRKQVLPKPWEEPWAGRFVME
jgi:hypothetical protein